MINKPFKLIVKILVAIPHINKCLLFTLVRNLVFMLLRLAFVDLCSTLELNYLARYSAAVFFGFLVVFMVASFSFSVSSVTLVESSSASLMNPIPGEESTP